MKYTILSCTDPKTLENMVNSMLAEGWKLQDGLAMSQSDFYSENYKQYRENNLNRMYAQALILENG